MNVALELRNEATGVYGREPEYRYQMLLLTGADRIEALEEQVKLLRQSSDVCVSKLKDLESFIKEFCEADNEFHDAWDDEAAEEIDLKRRTEALKNLHLKHREIINNKKD